MAAPAATAATTSSSSRATQRRLAPVEGSADYLVYVVGNTRHKAYVPAAEKTGTLYVKSRSGKVRNLGAILPEPSFSLVGSTLVETTFTSPAVELVSWWDLSGKAHGSFSVTAPERVVAAAPHGWLTTTNTDGAPLFYRHLDGTTTNLGHPLPKGVGYSVTTGAAGYVAFSDNDENGNGEITYASWKHPTKHRVLQKAGGQDNNSCGAVGSKWAVCGLYDVKHHPVALIRLSDSKQVRTTDKCRSGSAALVSGKAAWINHGPKGCTTGRLEMFSSHGHLTKSSRHNYNWRFQVGGLSKFVTTNKTQTKILGLTKANGTPKVLVRI